MFRHPILLTSVILASLISAQFLSNNENELIYPETATRITSPKESI
jgi:hypothetical protein